jgi:cobalt-zinc-cadmium efflux system protein
MTRDRSHSHGTENVSDSVLLWSIIINGGLSVFEFIAGVISGSVALMADALHNTNDAAALLIAYVARKISHKEPDERYTFGYRRAELIGAMIQLTALILVGLYLVYEAVRRLLDPEPLLGGWIMAAAGIALFVDVVTAWLLWAMSAGSLNVKAAFLHNLTDAGASIAVLFGGAAIFWFNWIWVDPVLTLVIAGYILYMSLGMLRQTARILMEGKPPDLSLREIRETLQVVDGVEDIHHLHVWELDEGHVALEAHVRMTGATQQSHSSLRKQIKNKLEHDYGIKHSTLEIENSSEIDCSESALINPEG